MDAASWWSPGDGGIHVAVRITPGARRSEVIDASRTRMRIRIAAPAIEGKANVAVEQFVAVLFGVRTSAVTMVRGQRSRDKTLWIAGIAAPPAALLPDA